MISDDMITDLMNKYMSKKVSRERDPNKTYKSEPKLRGSLIEEEILIKEMKTNLANSMGPTIYFPFLY